MNKKINNNFDEEYVNIKDLVSSTIKKNEAKIRTNKIFWLTFSILISILNIALIVVASFVLNKVISDNHSGTSILFAGIVAGLTIISFIVSITISVYQGVSKFENHKSAKEIILNEFFKYETQTGVYKKNQDTKLLKQNIKAIVKETIKKNEKFSMRKTLISILSGGNYE